jgi:GH15 family glucan-1,4-alpha-glucosidase
MSSPIEDYALIGDGQTAALVCRRGSIDWLCWPRFDSDSCFAALLGTPENGRWLIGPSVPGGSVRRYRQDTLILETEHATERGVVRVIDFMPIQKTGSALIRMIQGVSGRVPMQMELCLRANYGAVLPWFEPADGGYEGHVGPCHFTVDATFPMRTESNIIRSEFFMETGETAHVILRYGEAKRRMLKEVLEPAKALAATERFWRDWIGQFDKPTAWPDAVKRSLLTLKALIYQPSGALIAAPTTSLPEAPGGSLNWDYRFSWVRDAAFTVDALLNAGFHTEAKAWRDWLLCTVGAEPDKMRVMYRVNGERHIPESEIPWLQGYNYALPVRIGNAASTQHQADIFGELLDAMHLAAECGIERTQHSIEIETKIIDYLESSRQEPGAGLWESRGEARHYVYARVMAWVAVDRCLSSPGICEYAGASRVARWEALREAIHSDVCREGFHAGLNRFVEYYGGQELDGALLLLPIVNFLPIEDERITATIAAVERELTDDGLVRRKKPSAREPEGAFIACTLWLADCQNMQGRQEDARKTLERVLAIRNDVGLLAEEYNVQGRHLAGNFPQALSHLALVTTALRLCGPVRQRGRG